MQAADLPALPEPPVRKASEWMGDGIVVSVADAKAYARLYGQACAREAREQAARICDEINTESGGGFEPFAAAIREGMK